MSSAIIMAFERAWRGNNRHSPDGFTLAGFLATCDLGELHDLGFCLSVSFPDFVMSYEHWGKALRDTLGLNLNGRSVNEAALGTFGKQQREAYIQAILDGEPMVATGTFTLPNDEAITFERVAAPIFHLDSMQVHHLVGAVHYTQLPEGLSQVRRLTADLDRFSLERLQSRDDSEYLVI